MFDQMFWVVAGGVEAGELPKRWCTHHSCGVRLPQVERMAKLVKVAEDVAYTCETAAHFWLLHVLARWEKFLVEAKKRQNSPPSVKVSSAIEGILSAIRF